MAVNTGGGVIETTDEVTAPDVAWIVITVFEPPSTVAKPDLLIPTTAVLDEVQVTEEVICAVVPLL